MIQTESNLPVVLLIDDDQTLHLWANRNLPEAGFKLISCFDGKEGVEVFKEYSPNIVMIDIEMPSMDGFEVCSKIRFLPNGKNTPVVMMTVTEDHQKLHKLMHQAQQNFVVKPINWKVLVHRLHYMVKASSNLHKLAQSELRLSRAKNMARLGYWEWQINNDGLYWSDEIYSMVEIDQYEFTPDTTNFWDFIHANDLPYVSKHLQGTIRSKVAATIEFRIVTAKKQERFVSQHIEVVENHKGEIIRLIGTVQDITERKEQENKIRHLAYYDEVTQLPNRIFFFKFLAKTWNSYNETKKTSPYCFWIWTVSKALTIPMGIKLVTSFYRKYQGA